MLRTTFYKRAAILYINGMARSQVFNPPQIKVKSVQGKGRGVFATRDYTQGELIETCPVLLFDAEQSEHFEQTDLWHYLFNWDEETGQLALLFGYGMLYNHSFKPNARMVHDHDHEHQRTEVYAENNIKQGTEILLNYLGEPDATGELWFEMA